MMMLMTDVINITHMLLVMELKLNGLILNLLLGSIVSIVVSVKERDDSNEKLRQQMKMVQDSQQRCRQTLSEMADVNDRFVC